MDTGQDKEQARVKNQVAQPADESLKMHGDQLEKPLHEMLEDDDNPHAGSGEAETGSGQRSPQQ